MTPGQAWTLYLLMGKYDDGGSSAFRAYADAQVKGGATCDAAFRAAVRNQFEAVVDDIDDFVGDIGTVNSFGAADLRKGLPQIPYGGSGACPTQDEGGDIMTTLGELGS